MSTATIELLRTHRLICERLTPEHGPDLEKLLLDPRVARTLWPELTPPTKAHVASSLAAKIAHWDLHGFGIWLLRDRATGAMVGRGGLQHTFIAGVDEVEAGWAIVPERWGQGLATELALACVEVAFQRLGLLRIVAFTLPGNIASRRVMEKSGFSYAREIMHEGLQHVLYVRRPDGGDARADGV
jgi:RimJ/RimL family protein N-acetyltransferase